MRKKASGSGGAGKAKRKRAGGSSGAAVKAGVGAMQSSTGPGTGGVPAGGALEDVHGAVAVEGGAVAGEGGAAAGEGARAAEDKVAPPVKLGSLADLVGMTQEFRPLSVPLGDRVYEVEARMLTVKESREAQSVYDAHMALNAPRKPRAAASEPGGATEVDWESSEIFVVQGQAQALRSGFIFSKAVALAADLEGETLEERSEWVAENLPPGLVEAVVQEVMTRSGMESGLAGFF